MKKENATIIFGVEQAMGFYACGLGSGIAVARRDFGLNFDWIGFSMTIISYIGGILALGLMIKSYKEYLKEQESLKDK